MSGGSRAVSKCGLRGRLPEVAQVMGTGGPRVGRVRTLMGARKWLPERAQGVVQGWAPGGPGADKWGPKIWGSVGRLPGWKPMA